MRLITGFQLYFLKELVRQPASSASWTHPAPRFSRQVPVTIFSESNSPIAVTFTSASESDQAISSDQKPDVALVSEIITAPKEEDDWGPDTIQQVYISSDDDSLEVLQAEIATACARREEQDALEHLEKARCALGPNFSAVFVRTCRPSHSVRSPISSELLKVSAQGTPDLKSHGKHCLSPSSFTCWSCRPRLN